MGGTRAEHTEARAASTLASGPRQAAAGVHAAAAAAASLAALPGGAPALHGIEDLMIDDGAVGAAQGHLHGLCPSWRAAGALVLNVLGVDGVQGFAVTLTLAVMNVHLLFGLTVAHFDILQPGGDILAVRLLTYVTAGAWTSHDFPSLGQASVFVEGWAVYDSLLPDVLPSLADPAEVTVTAILVRLIMLQCHGPSSPQLDGASHRQASPAAFTFRLLFSVALGASQTDGLVAPQLELRDGAHLDGAVARRAHVSHHALPRPNDGAIKHAGLHGLAATGGTALRGLTAQLKACGAGGDSQLGAGDIPLLHEDLVLHSDTLVDEAGVVRGGPLRANILPVGLGVPPWGANHHLAGRRQAPSTALAFMEDVSEAQLAAFFTGLLRALGHTQAHHGILQVGAGAHVAALLPELANRVDSALVDTHLVRKAGGRGAATVIGDGRGQVPQRAAHS